MFSLFFFLLSSLLCLCSASAIKNTTKVWDIIHDNLPELRLPYFSDFLVLLQTVLTLTVINSTELSEIFLVMGIAQICRAICCISTVLPPLKNYHDKYRLGGINGTGSEYIFSGHACYSAVCAIYLYKKGIFSPVTIFVYNSLSQFSIVITRNHYTVDVILAWIIVPLIYGNVMSAVKSSEFIQAML